MFVVDLGTEDLRDIWAYISVLFLTLYSKCQLLNYICTCLSQDMRMGNSNNTWKNLSSNLSNKGYRTANFSLLKRKKKNVAKEALRAG